MKNMAWKNKVENDHLVPQFFIKKYVNRDHQTGLHSQPLSNTRNGMPFWLYACIGILNEGSPGLRLHPPGLPRLQRRGSSFKS